MGELDWKCSLPNTFSIIGIFIMLLLVMYIKFKIYFTSITILLEMTTLVDMNSFSKKVDMQCIFSLQLKILRLENENITIGKIIFAQNIILQRIS